MPELSAAQRGAGARVVDGVTLRRVYRKEHAGRRCSVCSFPMVKQLLEAEPGTNTHPTCGDAFEDALEALRRTLKRRGAGPVAAGPVPRPVEDTPLPEPPAETMPADIPTPSSPGTITDKQLRKLHASFHDAGISQRDNRLAFCTDTVYRPIGSTKDLSLNEAKQVIDALERVIHPDHG